MLKNAISNAKTTQNRNTLDELFREYQSINKVSSGFKRAKKNSNKKGMIIFLVELLFLLIVYSAICYFHPKMLKSTSTLLLSVFILIFLACLICWKESNSIKKFNNERVTSRYDEIYELLLAKGVNSENIQDVIDYFRSDLEAVNLLDANSPILNIILEFARKFFFLSLTYILTLLTADYIPQNRMWTYEISLIIIFISYVIILLIMLYKLVTKDTFSPKIRKLVVELKKIDVLNRIRITLPDQE